MSGEPLLVVDDNPVNSKLIKVLLSTEGYEVRVATNAEEALGVLDTFHPRLILMDLQLPGMDGLTLTRQLKSNPVTRDITVVALTAYAMKGDDERARASGCSGYITKPIDVRSFPIEIARYMESSKSGSSR
ncbi:MAG TPA: response regulator [Gammaproteobacteria bacterium]|nr:response regulator [Gammaproteobacteria bacterium]